MTDGAGSGGGKQVSVTTPPSGNRPRSRLVRRRSEPPLLRRGFRTNWYSDFYHRMLVLRWWPFLLAATTLYLAINVMFAGLLMLQPGTIDHARPGSFADAFFFSIQTMATIGYGVLTPVGLYANIVVTVETMISLVFVTFTTGITFSRFSRPTARVSFSKSVTVSPYNGVQTLSVRLANSRRNQILEADVRLTLVRNERTVEGQRMRRFHDLVLARGHTPIFALTFTVMHPIDERSPLYGEDVDSLAAQDMELLVTVTGLDETMSQTIHARYSYSTDEILFNHRFADMFGSMPDGRMVIDYNNFDRVEALAGASEATPVPPP